MRHRRKMSPGQWQQVCELVDKLGSRPAEERQPILDRYDSMIRAEAIRLLEKATSAARYFTGDLFQGAFAGILPNIARFQDGELIANRFEIKKYLGAGGMGEVYEAHDRRLGGTVALKTLLTRWDCDSKMSRLFEHEVRLAKEVTHVNAVRIHDFGEYAKDGGETSAFFTMELLSGAPLSDGLISGGWTSGQRSDILKGIAKGLAAAHQAGVVHRDLKPANIIICSDGPEGRLRPVITDFGLALPDSNNPKILIAELSRQHDGAGTPLYMAPECFEGGMATAASDVYAFGLIAYEVLLGTRPFSHLPALGALISRGRSCPPLDAANLPAAWRRILARCLLPEPEQRFRDASQIVGAMERSPAIPRRSVLITAGTVSLAAAAFRLFSVRQIWRPVDRRLVLAPIESPAGDEYAWLDTAMQQTLAQSEHLVAWDRRRVAEVMERMGLSSNSRLDATHWREIALREGYRQIAFWTLSPVAGEYSLTIRLERLNNNSPRVAEAKTQTSFASASREDLLNTVHLGARWLRGQLGESAGAIDASNRLPQDITTSSYDALRAFARGEETAKKNRSAAVLDFDEALRHDNGFTLALVRKGDMLTSTARFAEGLKAWHQALDSSARRPLSRREDLEFRGMLALDSGDPYEGERIYAEYIRRFPDRWYGYYFREYPLVWINRAEEALEMLRQARNLIPAHEHDQQMKLQLHMNWTLLALDRLPEAASQAEEIAKLAPRSYYRYWAAAATASHSRDWHEAAQFFELAAAHSAGDIQSEMFANRTVALTEAGQHATALQLAQECVERYVREGLRASAAVHCVQYGYLLAQDPGAKSTTITRVARRAVELDKSPEILGHAATLAARCGNERNLNWLLQEVPIDLEIFPRYQTARLRILGEQQASMGNRKEAAASFYRASESDPRPFGNELLIFAGQALRDPIRVSQAKTDFQRIHSFYSRLSCPVSPAMLAIQSQN